MSVREPASLSRANSAYLVFDHFLRGWREMRRKGSCKLRARTPRKALRGGISKSIPQRPCHFLAINAHKMAPRTSKGLQERAWDAPTKGLLWIRLRAASCIKEVYLTQRVSKVVLQKSIPPQICQLIFYYY